MLLVNNNIKVFNHKKLELFQQIYNSCIFYDFFVDPHHCSNCFLDICYFTEQIKQKFILFQMEGKKNSYLVKVIVIGDSGVGKTNLITRFCQNHFKDTYVATIGVDFKIKTLPIGQRTFKMQIWDTAGQQRFRNITQTYYKGAAGIVLTYSITDMASFVHIQAWAVQIVENAPSDVSKILIGTKQDLEGQRVVTTQQGKQLAQKLQIPFLQVSAKSGFQIRQIFEGLGEQIVKKQEQKGEVTGFGSQKSNLLIRNHVQPQQKCAC